MDIQYPWALLLVLLIPLLLVTRKLIVRTGFSQVEALGRDLQPGLLKTYGPDLLAGIAMLLMVLAVANLRYSSYWQKSYPESKWIMLVQDLSGSMGRSSNDTGNLTLGDVALEGASSFIDMRKNDDLIGIIAFSNIAQLIAPPSFDRSILKSRLELLRRKNDSSLFRDLTVGGETNASYATWLAVCVFFMFLPEESQPSYEQINDLRYSLMGRSNTPISIPAKLKNIPDIDKGLLNFVNVIGLVRKLGVKLYIVVVGGDVSNEVRQALEEPSGDSSAGRIFYMPRLLDQSQITAVYDNINRMEKNRLLVKLEKRKKNTRGPLALAAAGMLAAYCLLRVLPATRKI